MLIDNKWKMYCSNSSVLTIDYLLFTDESLLNMETEDNKGLDPSKAHGHDMMSIRMLKIYGDSIYKPLALIFRVCLEHLAFP